MGNYTFVGFLEQPSGDDRVFGLGLSWAAFAGAAISQVSLAAAARLISQPADGAVALSHRLQPTGRIIGRFLRRFSEVAVLTPKRPGIVGASIVTNSYQCYGPMCLNRCNITYLRYTSKRYGQLLGVYMREEHLRLHPPKIIRASSQTNCHCGGVQCLGEPDSSKRRPLGSSH